MREILAEGVFQPLQGTLGPSPSDQSSCSTRAVSRFFRPFRDSGEHEFLSAWLRALAATEAVYEAMRSLRNQQTA